MQSTYNMNEVDESEIFVFNKQAMENLKTGKVLNSERFLLQAQSLLKNYEKSLKTSRLWAITYNNLACVYRSKGQLEKSLQNLFLALEIEEKYQKNPTNIASIYLNIASIYSQLNYHKKSLHYSLEVIKLLKQVHESQKSSQTDSLLTENFWISLNSAYLSAGNELEFLLDLASASKVYQTGLRYSLKFLGVYHILTLKLKKSLESLERKTNSNPLNDKTSPGRSLSPIHIDFSPISHSKTNKSSINSKLPKINSRLKRAGNGFSSVQRERNNQSFISTKQKFETINKINPSLTPKLKPVATKQEKQNSNHFVLESDDEKSSLTSISEDIETKKLFDSAGPYEVNSFNAKTPKNCETTEIGVSCDLSQNLPVFHQHTQTTHDTSSVPTQTAPSPGCERLAALVIQKHWKNLKIFKKPQKSAENDRKRLKSSRTPHHSGTPQTLPDSEVFNLNLQSKLNSSRLPQPVSPLKSKAVKASLDLNQPPDLDSNQAPVPQRSKIYLPKPNNSP